MERFSFVFLVAGLGFFVLAFIVSAWLPWVQFQDVPILSLDQLAAKPPLEFYELQEQYPQAFEKAFGEHKTAEGAYDMPKAFAHALTVGRKVYVGEACWHCHSQQVRPVGGDEARFGRVSYPEEYNNALNFPPLWGTRRVGPDLIRQNGKHSNDWHVAHFWNPPDVSPTSVMPRYPWFFEPDTLTPNLRGLSVIAYVQWLGSWQSNWQEDLHGVGAIGRAFPSPSTPQPAQPTPQTPQTKPSPKQAGEEEF